MSSVRVPSGGRRLRVAAAASLALLLGSFLSTVPRLVTDLGDVVGGGRSTSYLANVTTARRSDEIESERRRRRGLQQLQAAADVSPGAFQCPSLTRPPPGPPPLPTLRQSTYAASFPGSGDAVITRSLVEGVTGLFVGEAAASPSLAKLEALQEMGGGKKEEGGAAATGAPGEEWGAEQDEGGEGTTRGQGSVVALRTHFPHTSGKLASWDDDIPRAVVILRNPLHAIPNYFDQMYETRSHLPRGASNRPENAELAQAAWVKWRDNQFHSQIMLYRRFVSFWMEKYLTAEGNRVYFAYEQLVDEETGPLEAVRLASFMGEGVTASAMEWIMANIEEGEGVKGEKRPLDEYLSEGLSWEETIDAALREATRTMADAEDVPCLWKEVVHSAIHRSPTILPAASVNDGEATRRRRLGGGEGGASGAQSLDASDWSPSDRPYTPENLAEMSQVILELMNRWSRHQRLLGIMSRYHREVNRAYLEETGQLEEAIKERDRYDRARKGAQQGGPSPEVVAQQSQQQQPPQPSETMPAFHIVQASPADDPASAAVATNWLMGLFEPTRDYAFMEGWPERPVRQSGRDVTIDSTVVTRTHDMELLGMYKMMRPNFDEVFFVVSATAAGQNPHIGEGMCDYKNVLCVERAELVFDGEDERRAAVRSLTNKFRTRFGYYFGADSGWLREENESNAVERLDAMARTAADMAGEGRTEEADVRFGVRGDHQSGGFDGGVISGPAATGAAVTGENDQSKRRRLSAAKPDGGCEIKWPQPPEEHIQTAYAASYPGCGARMSWNLIEALTGLWTGDDWDNNKRGKRVVTVKTHYPHDAGRLVDWDDEITRALVVVRNPMNAIPSFFNHIYEIKNNLAIHSQRAPVSDWIEWRDRLAEGQIRKYAKFVDYWMERFDRHDGDRIFVSYETLTDDNDGPGEAVRITNFLAQSEGVDPIALESVPCVWRAVVKYKQQASVIKEPGASVRRRLDPRHHDSQRSGPTERPYTPELLDAMSQMLGDLIKRWGDRHLRLRKTLEGYRKDVQIAYLAVTNPAPLADRPQTPGKNFHIVQASLPHTGSTVLNNLLAGLFDPDAEYKKSSMISITHDFDLLSLYKRERPKYDEIFFVVSNQGEDPGSRVNKDLCEYSNVLCLEHEEVQYNNQQELHDVVNNFSNKFQSSFQSFFGPGFLDETKRMYAVNRLEAMDKAVAELKGQPSDVKVEIFGVNDGSVGDGVAGGSGRVNGKSFHVFQASPPHTASAVVTNWLMGLFEPNKDYSFMLNNPEQTVRNHDITVPIDSTVVTKTHILDLMMLYKQYRPYFDEILFVVSNRGNNPETRINDSMCQYDNVMCVEYEDLLFSDKRELLSIVSSLTNKFAKRFEYFFGADYFGKDKVASAMERLEGMAQVAESLAGEPYSVSDPKYGVHGGHGKGGGEVARGRVFYCGGARRFLGTPNFKYSTFGLFLAKSLFSDFEFDIAVQDGNKLVNSAIPLTEDTLKSAADNDLLIVHSHQHCEVSVEVFPGYAVHINAEYYDLHPKHLDNKNGELTFDYLPPGDRSFVLGLHKDTKKSLRVPYCSMRFWYLHMTKQTQLNKIFDPVYRPKNTRENFLLYINSHFIEFRERAARDLSEIGTIHTAGKCQGYFEANPPPPDDPNDDSAIQCVPFDDSQRPLSIKPISGQLGTTQQHNNMELYSHYRYALVMENADVPGYVSEKILHAFLSGTVPIYFGSRFVFEIFNPKAFIYFDLEIPQQALSQIRFMEQNPSEYEKMMNEPILAHGQETIEKYFSWDESVGNGKLKARIREMMGLS